MGSSPTHVLSIGDCPVAPGAEVVLVLVARDSGQTVFWCPDCGCAWNSVPAIGLDKINSLADVAPSGIRLAKEEDLAGIALGDRSLLQLAYANWSADLDALLHGPDVQKARLQAARIAGEVLAGEVSPVIGAVDLTRLRPSLDVPDDDPEFEIFMLIDSECEGLPIGPVRQYWSVEALARQAPAVADAERWAMETGRQAFQRVVDRFAGAA